MRRHPRRLRSTVGGPVATWAAILEAPGRERSTLSTTQLPLNALRSHRSHSLVAASSAVNTSGTVWFLDWKAHIHGRTFDKTRKVHFLLIANAQSASTRSAP